MTGTIDAAFNMFGLSRNRGHRRRIIHKTGYEYINDEARVAAIAYRNEKRRQNFNRALIGVPLALIAVKCLR